MSETGSQTGTVALISLRKGDFFKEDKNSFEVWKVLHHGCVVDTNFSRVQRVSPEKPPTVKMKDSQSKVFPVVEFLV